MRDVGDETNNNISINEKLFRRYVLTNVISVHGECKTNPAGRSNFISRKCLTRAIARLAPAESPLTTIFEGGISRFSTRCAHAAIASII